MILPTWWILSQKGIECRLRKAEAGRFSGWEPCEVVRGQRENGGQRDGRWRPREPSQERVRALHWARQREMALLKIHREDSKGQK